MGLTDFAQRINYQRALQGELERTIMSLDGIESARVHLSLGEDRIFRDDRVPPKASVTLRMRDQARLSSATAQGIQRLVAAAVPNLESGAVVIIDEKGGLIGTPAAEPAAVMLPPALQEERGIEEYYSARITDAVHQAVPQLSPTIRVVAEMGNGDRTSLVDWTPAARNFPLHVTVEGTVDPTQQQLVRNAVQDVVGTVTGVIDTTEFVPSQKRSDLDRSVPANMAQPAPVGIPDAKLAAEDDGGSWGPFTVGLIIFAGLLLLILAGLSRIRLRGRLSERQRQNFVLRLRGVLTDGGAHAAGS